MTHIVHCALYEKPELGKGWLGSDQIATLSIIKIRQAGFGDCVDSAEMLEWWLRELQRRRILPP